jgi:hypothetical protein
MKYLKYFTIVLLIIGVGTLYYFKDNIMKSAIFKLKKIVITDVPHYSFEDLVDRVSVNKNVSIFDIDLLSVEKNLLELSWIKKVRVTRELPNKISVSLEEHEIKGVLLFDILYFYDDDYSIFLKAFPSEIKDKVIYSGLTMNDYENDFTSFKNKLIEMESISKYFEQSNLKKECFLSEVSSTEFRGYQVLLKCENSDKDIKIILGFKDFLKELNRSQVILQKSKERKENLEMIIFNELKSNNSVLVKIEKEGSIDG